MVIRRRDKKAACNHILGALIIIMATGTQTHAETFKTPEHAIQEATVYKSPTCGCCNGYVKTLEEYGLTIETINTHDLTTIKNAHNIPSDKRSCHTMVIGDYVVEGHVPIAALNKLLEEKPAIDGIGLAGMPIGTPGMPGPQREDYEIYAIEGTSSTPFMTIPQPQ